MAKKNDTDKTAVLDSGASASSYQAALASIDSTVLDDLDCTGKPLAKDEKLERELVKELADDIARLPEPWMGLACIRCRKYDGGRAKDLMQNLVKLIKELTDKDEGGPLSYKNDKEHIELHKFRIVGRDKLGRTCLATDLGYHNPKETTPLKMMRTVVFLLLNALRCGPEGTPEGGDLSQLNGICILHNFTNVSWANLDPRLENPLIQMLSKMPIRLGAVYIMDPPWFLRYVVLPIARLFMSKKLIGRVIVVDGPKDLKKHFDMNNISSKPKDLGGRSSFDPDQWAETHTKDIYL